MKQLADAFTRAYSEIIGYVYGYEKRDRVCGSVMEELTRWDKISFTAGIMLQDGSAEVQFGNDVWVNTRILTVVLIRPENWLHQAV